jgi:tetratricopeptide (TPR) repeat protein
MLSKKYLLAILLAQSFTALAQPTEQDVRNFALTKSEQEIVTENSRMMQDGFLYFAEILADKLVSLNTNSSNYNYRKGFVHQKLTGDFEKSLPYMKIAVKNTDPNYDAYSSKEKSAPTDAYFHLASLYHLNEDIDSAKYYYQQFINLSKKTSELVNVAKLRLIQCDVAKQLMAQPVNARLKNIGSGVNTEYPEYSAVVSLDGSSLYFTSRRQWAKNETEKFKDYGVNQYPEDVFLSHMDIDSTWIEAKLLNFCLPKRNEATMAVSTDERRIYLYEDSTGSGDIYYTDFYASKFSDIEKLNNDKVNSPYWETHAMVSPDRSRMFFTSDRPGGYGGLDIYMSLRKADSTWGTPVNLGPKVNSAFDEDAPFVSVDNNMLYFSSNGEKSMGGFDVLVCYLLPDGTWSESRNIGYPFNSTNDEIYYTTTVDGLRGYLTSVRKGGFGEKDIYEIHNDFLGVKNIASFKGVVRTSDGSPLPEDFALTFKLFCDDCDDDNKTRVLFPRLRDGMFMTGIKPCKTYTITYYNSNDNTIMLEETFMTDCKPEYQEIYRDLILTMPERTLSYPVDTTQVIDPVDVSTHKNIEFIHYFDYNKNKLNVRDGELKAFVKEVEKQLKEGRTRITINVYSSASHVPTKTYETNEKLTQIRAENMRYDLSTYFEGIPEYTGKVNVVIVTAIVDGPEYVKDAKNKKKYKPYQFVGLKTE